MTLEQIIIHFIDNGQKPRKAKIGEAGCVLAIRSSPLGVALVFMLVGPDAREVVAAEAPDPSWEIAYLIVDEEETSDNLKDGCNKVVVAPSKFTEPWLGETLLTLQVAVPLTQEQKDILAADAAAEAAKSAAEAARHHVANAAEVVHHVADAAAEAVKSAFEAAFASPAPAPGAVERHH